MSLIDLIFPRRCYSCNRVGSYFCPDCRPLLTSRPVSFDPGSPFEGRLSMFKYHSFIKRAVADLKYGFVTDLVPELSNLVASLVRSDYPHLYSYWLENSYCLVPVPLHPFRNNWRGFNQSALLASAISSDLGLCFNSDLLIRRSYTKSQVKISKLQRFTNTVSSFSLGPQIAPPRKIILFDDVYTTGSTLRSAASVFPSGTSIWLFTLAAG